MVAKVISGKNILGALHYNEEKVKAGNALCIMANQFGCEPAELNFYNKINRFEKLIGRNQKAKTNAIHISLNFDVTENINRDRLKQIAGVYMDKIGFGHQPYLVYQHHDAAHPHIHILTTNIQENGHRIDIHNIGRNQSEKARKEIETLFGLVKAEGKKKSEDLIKPIDVKRATYGKAETKRSISNAVRMVSREYKYTSFPEYNAALRQFNVVADRGREGTNMYNKNGLLYSLLDNNGDKVGIPIKASSIYDKPTLSYLEKRYKLNEALRQPHQHRLKTCISNCLNNKSSITQTAFAEAMNKEGIYVLLRQSVDGRIYGVTFVDNKTKVVFNGSDLGKQYSAKAILEKISDPTYSGAGNFYQGQVEPEKQGKPIELNLGWEEIIKDLTTARQFDFTSPDTAIKKNRKKKRKGHSL
jgi:Relaxase/Mobilisation nuclease domain